LLLESQNKEKPVDDRLFFRPFVPSLSYQSLGEIFLTGSNHQPGTKFFGQLKMKAAP